MLELLRLWLTECVGYLQLILETISVFCIIVGLIQAFYFVLILRLKEQDMRLLFGKWLAMALEFQLAADILVTTVEPDMESLIRLAVIALIRTFLNYFLSKELEQEKKEESGKLSEKQNAVDKKVE